jgi:hypothetical protein
MAHSASVVGSGARSAAQALAADCSSAVAALRREGQSVSSLGEREHVEQLQLVVEVVLEPEHHLDVVAERLEQLPVASLE